MKKITKQIRHFLVKFNLLKFVKAYQGLSSLKKVLLLLSLLAIVVAFIFIIYYTNLFTDLIYDQEVADRFGKNTLFSLFFFPLILVLISTVLVSRVFYSFIKRKSFNELKFKLIGFFSLGLFFTALVYILLYDFSFDVFINIVNNQKVAKNLEVKLSNQRLDIRKKQESLDEESRNRIKEKDYTLKDSDLSSIFINYDRRFIPIFILKKDEIKYIPKIDFNEFLLADENYFSSFDETEGFVFNLYKEEESPNPYFLAIAFIPENLKEDIKETLDLVEEVKQFQEFLPNFKRIIFLVSIYILVQVFSLMIIFFYYRLTKYFSPINKLSKSTIELSKGNYAPPYLAEIRRIEENEFKDLIDAFRNLIFELRSNRKRLKRLTEIETWREIVEKLAHEIKNPLTPIKLATNQIESTLIQKDILVYEKLGENFNFIYSEVNRIENLLKDISLFPQFSLVKNKTNISIIFDKITKFINRYAQIHFTKDIAEVENIYLYIDEEKIYQAILNLVKNAIESLESKKSGDKIIHLASKITFDEKDQKILEIRISDNGAGIDKGKKEEIFKPYVTTKKTGTGLGLPITEEIIHLHNGMIDLSTETNLTCFIISLPLSD